MTTGGGKPGDAAALLGALLSAGATVTVDLSTGGARAEFGLVDLLQRLDAHGGRLAALEQRLDGVEERLLARLPGWELPG